MAAAMGTRWIELDAWPGSEGEGAGTSSSTKRHVEKHVLPASVEQKPSSEALFGLCPHFLHSLAATLHGLHLQISLMKKQSNAPNMK
jgi:hypothetical protein